MRRRPAVGLGLAAILAALLLAARVGAQAQGPAELAGVHIWRSTQPRLGGISGFDLAPDGVTFTAVSDRGRLLTGRLQRDAAGSVTGTGPVEAWPLLDERGQPLDWGADDAEGLTVTAGGIVVSFEGAAPYSRVMRYARPGGPAVALPRAAEFDGFPENGGMEALTADAAGAIYTLPERGGPDIPVLRLAGGRWSTAFHLPRDRFWKPVAADFGPDGRLYLLERGFFGPGFSSRLRRFTPRGAALLAETLLETGPGYHDNLEALAIWRDGAGRLRATMVSDDNFLWLQRTEIVDYRLPE
ncbi:esterase-like activity of phytase family protein [Frigidibacter oleivorans]|uniref:esterase-like activity of phytase family protein n=1 Tax=Frigidibacter oleivorans TaxID=2487129 RepID=UPI000F8D7075|nr:esterase-like activity of phytase family protein [Frigidibacter oleivorans]